MKKKNKEIVYNKNGVSQVTIKSLKGQMLSERELYALNNHEVEGLLGVEVVRKGSTFKLVYNLTGLMPLSDFLLTPMNRDVFARILQNILKVLTGMQKLHFNQNAINLELERVMVNPVKQRLLFMYIPIQGYNSGSSLRAFLMDIICAGRFVKEKDSNYVQEYIHILKEGINFSIFELEEYIKKLIAEKEDKADKKVSCHRCGVFIGDGVRFCPICGAKLVNASEQDRNDKIYDPSEWSQEREKVTLSDSCEKEYPYLIREKTSERIVIDKSEFSIGRSAQSCDYAVEDNRMVGRRHAIILCIKGQYFIEDLHSTNKTYVNEQAVEKEEIVSGSRIRLADEDFIFYENL